MVIETTRTLVANSTLLTDAMVGIAFIAFAYSAPPIYTAVFGEGDTSNGGARVTKRGAIAAFVAAVFYVAGTGFLSMAVDGRAHSTDALAVYSWIFFAALAVPDALKVLEYTIGRDQRVTVWIGNLTPVVSTIAGFIAAEEMEQTLGGVGPLAPLMWYAVILIAIGRTFAAANAYMTDQWTTVGNSLGQTTYLVGLALIGVVLSTEKSTRLCEVDA